MVKKCLCIALVIASLLLQSTGLCSAEVTKEASGQKPPQSMESTKLINPDILDSVIKSKLEEEEKKRKAEKEKAEQLKKQESENKITELKSALTADTYLKYIKDLGYYKKIYKNDEKLNIRNALLLFQSDHNMSMTGTWDEATKAMLINRLLSGKIFYLDKIDKAPSKDKWITVNKTTRVLTLYEDSKVMKKYPVAVGNPASLTKSGKFIINMKIVNPDWGGGGFAKPIKGGTPENPLGSRWLGINRTDGSYGIHGTNSFYSIGKYISHGCIRMQNYCVEELYPLVPMKAPVWVGTEAELKTWGIIQPAFTYQQETEPDESDKN